MRKRDSACSTGRVLHSQLKMIRCEVAASSGPSGILRRSDPSNTIWTHTHSAVCFEEPYPGSTYVTAGAQETKWLI
ncbi:hypothetical protein CesoFtcFv8_019522 [Champsocephalus esox]|uniref:Uncharacterized protein n=1 Tax=Champsocephalus esox TaxID=159716 RepID=A0AAN8GMR0_9TELE|nr:hypothetical protein CesoFtcFv8_019522 [Champsocephalus esox]